ncbi:MAG: acyl-CoA dehydrogenase family protein [Acidimicrobiales bacterium]
MTAVESSTDTSNSGTADRSGDAARVAELVDEVLAAHDPATTDKATFRGAMYDAGLAWVHFPEGSGGLGLAPTLQKVVDERLRGTGAPGIEATQFFGLALAGPTVVSHGSEDLKDRTLRSMYTGEDAWCQLFSEPGAGSDLAGLACRAVRDGDEWVVNGQKVWNTMAHLADKGMLVARSDPDQPKHKGLTYFMVDMHAPGVEVRPLRQITGEAEFNEVYLTDVRIPDADRIGDVGDGWRVSMTTLMNERTSIGGGGGGPRPAGSGPIAEVVRIWHEELADHERGAATRDQLMDLWVRAEVLRLTNIRAGQNRKLGNPGPESSISKLAIALINKDIYEFCVDMLGPRGLVDYDFEMRRADAVGLEGPPGSARKMFLRSRANSIEGGTSEIMKNILGERVLGLPGEPRTDKDVAWKDVPK